MSENARKDHFSKCCGRQSSLLSLLTKSALMFRYQDGSRFWNVSPSAPMDDLDSFDFNQSVMLISFVRDYVELTMKANMSSAGIWLLQNMCYYKMWSAAQENSLFCAAVSCFPVLETLLLGSDIWNISSLFVTKICTKKSA